MNIINKKVLSQDFSKSSRYLNDVISKL